MNREVKIFNEIVALQVYQNNKNYDQTDTDLSGNPLHLSGLVMRLEKSEWENRIVRSNHSLLKIYQPVKTINNGS
jgi:hypothetical protein